MSSDCGCQVIRLRPSGHSEDYVIVADYESKEDAERALKRLQAIMDELGEREDPPEWVSASSCKIHDTKAIVEVNFVDELPEPIAIILEGEGARAVRTYEVREVIKISVKVPKGLKLEAALLLTNRGGEKILRILLERIGRPKVVERKRYDLWMWNLPLFILYDKTSNSLWIDDKIYPLPEDWRVHIKRRKHLLMERVKNER